MKIKMSLVGAITLIIFGIWSSALGDSPTVDSEREVMAYFSPGAILPKNSLGVGTLADFTIKNGELDQLFNTYGVEKLMRIIPGFQPSDRNIIGRRGQPVELFDWYNSYILLLPHSSLRAAFLEGLKDIDVVQNPVLHGSVEPCVTSTDTFFGLQWYLNNTGSEDQGFGTANADVNAEKGWDFSTGSSAISLGIIDTGVQLDHPEFSGRITGANDLVGAHATVVAGIAAAKGDNGFGVAGVAWDISIHNVDYRTGADGWIIGGIYSCILNGDDVINMSFQSDPFTINPFMHFIIIDYLEFGGIPVAAVGNDFNSEGSGYMRFPGAYPRSTIGVGATTNEDVQTSYSNTGYWVDVTAPGGGGDVQNPTTTDENSIFTTVTPSNYSYETSGGSPNTGTSFSTPIVSGMSALILSEYPDLYYTDVRALIRIAVKDLGSPGRDDVYGTGRVLIPAAFNLLENNQIEHYQVDGSWASIVNDGYLHHINVNGGEYCAYSMKVEKTITFPQSYDVPPHVWGRWEDSNGLPYQWPYETSLGHTEVVEGSVTTSSVTLRTYMYELWSIDPYDGRPDFIVGMYPYEDESDLDLAYSVLPDNPPIAPTLQISGSVGEHPSLTWNNTEREEHDIDHFVLKKTYTNVGGSWTGYVDPVTIPYVDNGMVINRKTGLTTATYWVKAVDKAEQSSIWSNSKTTSGLGPMWKKTIEEGQVLPTEYAIGDPYPNPFNPIVSFPYELPESADIEISIHDIMGRTVWTYAENSKLAGYYTLEWPGIDSQGNQVASGLYLISFTTPEFKDLQKATLIR
ncbi:MAG: S8 family serine peptidase [Candidatus Marinimicrobia bacterium]|nr:S8 family serine peptidase [FCB group bacterium]MBL7046692.1 S8 family serine peptidase [Candidatus Neomarinimicrobiota bacterium]